MKQEEFIDRLFETINETHNLPIKDIDTDATENTIYSRAIKFAKSRCIAPIRYAIIRAYLMGGKSYGKY